MAHTDAQLRKINRRKVLNQELSLKEFAEKKIVLESRPSKVLVELTQNCNFKCLMCNQSWEDRYKKYNPDFNMSLKMFDKVASSLFDDAHLVDLRGLGETTILPQWPEVVDRLEAYPLVNWHLVTNLSLPRDETWSKMIDFGFILGFSCDGATKETFEKIRVRSHFDRIVHNLELISDRIKRTGRGMIYFIVVVQRANLHELAAIVELAHRFGVPEVQFKKVREGEQYFEMLTAAEKSTLKKSLERSVDVALERGVRLTLNDQELLEQVAAARAARAGALPIVAPGINFPAPALDPQFAKAHPWTTTDAEVRDTFRVSVHKKCFKPFHYTTVIYDGRVGTCNHMMMNPDILEMGDLSKQPFEEIWNGEPYQFFRGSLAYGKPLDDRCRWCFAHRLED